MSAALETEGAESSQVSKGEMGKEASRAIRHSSGS